MGFNFRRFVSRGWDTMKRVGNTLNRTVNNIKWHAKKIIPIVKEVSHYVREGAKNYSHLPVVGSYMSGIAQGADAVNRAATLADSTLSGIDSIQQDMGWSREPG